MSRKPIIALTGGIASGKSYVAERFAALGATLVDTDLLAREVVLPGTAAAQEIRAAFGPAVFASDGSLNRAVLRELVFGDDAARARLEAIVHPRIRALARVRSANVSGAYALVVIPLLTEKGRYDFLDSVVVVDCSPELQRSRLRQRDQISSELAGQMLKAQATRAQRLHIADHVIRNDGVSDPMPAIRLLHHGFANTDARAMGHRPESHPDRQK